MALAWGGLAAPRATFCKPMNENLLIYASFLFEAVFWLGAYALILYHAFKEKTYGVPVVAMCGNIAWEFIFGLNRFPACPVYWADCSPTLMTTLTLMAALMDAVILFTVLYFGRHQFKGPFWLRYFIPLTLAGVAFSFVLQHSLMGGLYTPNYYGAAVNGSIPEFLQIGLQGGMFTGWALGGLWRPNERREGHFAAFARLQDGDIDGFLLVTDKFPVTQLAFVAR